MSGTVCNREAEVLDAVLAARWPDGCDPELRAHVESCPVCRDGLAIASAFRLDRDDMRDVPIPAAGQIWWRAAIRARAEAAHAAARPMVWLQAVTGAAAVGGVAAGISMIWPRIESAFGGVLPFASTSWHDALPLLLAIGAGILAAPIAFYLAVPRD